ncbi:universal stress protein [Beggiatoa leptomitoformis]|uniref:Universal stress protein n=1 Tax=Beggiatoa leptomitoformis TaxID=288004 RepID=A0A2N9YHY6_9GAMM|nr:universal stress protein [Beggiatoa leptomitoformis]ALG67753.1 universal stress protein [Beggiatoa leptomitoformis]AUI70005.1 universal stress protein [Beggiatoa leptomitoformis]
MLPQIKKILYPADLGEQSRPVLRYAISMAQKYGATIRIIHVLEPLGTVGAALLETYIPRDMAEKMHTDAINEVRSKMQQRLEAFCAEELHTTSAESHLIDSIAVLDGSVAQTIVEQVKESGADMIIMGTHNYSVLGEFFIGSVARRVTQISQIPVLVVPMHVNKTFE